MQSVFLNHNDSQLISVIMPVYNVEDVICISINSILQQTYSNFELIVINDGSTDRTQSIIEEFATSDKRIKVFNKTNGGASEARNFGLDIANGKFITFCDADDFVYGNWLDEMVNNSTNADIVITGFTKDNQGVITKHGFNYSGYVKDILSDYPDLTMIGALWNKLFDRDIIEKYNLRLNTEFSFREDEEFVFRYLRYCKIVNIIDCCTYHYYEPDWNKYSRQIASLTGFDMVCSIFDSLKIIGVTGYLYESNYNDLATRCLYNCKHNPKKIVSYLRQYINTADKQLIFKILQMGGGMTKRSIKSKFNMA